MTSSLPPSIEDGIVSTVVSHETTRDISVWAPEAEGAWPVVYALPGMSGDRTRWDVAGLALARQGVVVFATDYRPTEPQHVGQDLECGYRYAMTLAEEYGGDLDQPVTIVGHSFGATMALFGGLSDDAGPGGTFGECFTGTARPDVIIAISGCHYDFLGQKIPFDASRLGNREANLVLVTGADDNICEPWQSADATEALRSVGYEVDLVRMTDANHMSVIFHDLVDGALDDGVLDDGEVLTVPDAPTGHEVVQTILDAITAAQ